MSVSHTSRVKASLMSYLDRDAKKREREGKPTKKNNSPEKTVQDEILAQCKRHGFELYVTDNAAKWNSRVGRYVVSTDFESGMSDLTGDREGRTCYIEVKAPRKRSTLKDHQRAFLERKIDRGCFAIVADDWQMVLRTFASWQMENFSKHFLRNHLPTKRKQNKPKKGPESLPF